MPPESLVPLRSEKYFLSKICLFFVKFGSFGKVVVIWPNPATFLLLEGFTFDS